MEPLVKRVVQIDVRQERRQYRPLRRAFPRRHQLLVFQYTYMQAFSDETQKRPAGNSFTNQLQEVPVWRRVEEASDVRLDNPFRFPPIAVAFRRRIASCALLFGLKPYEPSRKSCSYTAERSSRIASWTILSSNAQMPSDACPTLFRDKYSLNGLVTISRLTRTVIAHTRETAQKIYPLFAASH